MAIVFNSVTQFYEQIGRRREHRKRTELDTLECIFVGDQSQASDVCPRDLTRHPEFPGMFCTGWTVTNKEALMAEVRANYVGKLDGSTISPPVISTSWHEGSISWTNWEGSWEKSLTPGYFVQYNDISYNAGLEVSMPGVRTFVSGTSETHYVSVSRTARFTARAVTFKYFTCVEPSHTAGIFGSLSLQYQGIENLQVFVTGTSDSMSKAGLVTAWPIWDMKPIDLQINDQANGWWEVTEVYSTRAYIGSSVAFLHG